MKIRDILEKSGKPFASLEIVPPFKGVTKEELLNSIRPFADFNPPFINVTCHRDEYEYRQDPDGRFTRHVVRKRVSQTAVCAAIQEEFKMEVVPHLICAGASADRTESLLHDFKFIGINNIMALRGDCLIGEKRFVPEPDGYSHANELVEAIRAFSPESFCIGVAAYPEKHFEAPNLQTDIAMLKKKIDAGADYIITQMFFDNNSFYSFKDACHQAGITVPIIPGLKPLSTARQINMLPESFSIDIPEELVKEVTAHSDSTDACYRIGLEWCLAQSEDLLKHGVPAIHYYTMGKPGNIVEILSKLF